MQYAITNHTGYTDKYLSGLCVRLPPHGHLKQAASHTVQAQNSGVSSTAGGLMQTISML